MSDLNAQQAKRVELANRLLDATEFEAMYLPVSDTTKPGGDGVSARTRRFYGRHLDLKELRRVAAQAYAEAFDEVELSAIIAWMESPVGKKFREFPTTLSALIQPMFIRIHQKHQAEYFRDVLDFPPLPPEPSPY